MTSSGFAGPTYLVCREASREALQIRSGWLSLVDIEYDENTFSFDVKGFT